MAAANASSNAGRLRVLREADSMSEDTVDIVLVPGIGTLSPDSWPFARPEWLSSLPMAGAGVRIIAYEYDSPFQSSKPAWESVLMQGYDLLAQLSSLQTQRQQPPVSKTQTEPEVMKYTHSPYKDTRTKPLVLVCHSLGGVIAKQALCVANKQFPRYGTVVNAIVGIVFLSTPHRYGDNGTTLLRFRDILEATTGKTVKISTANVEQEGAVLVDLADRFEGISLRTPILSTYELRDSKISTAALRSKSSQLVTRDACSTHAPMEKVVGLNLNHHNSCLFTTTVGNEGLAEFDRFLKQTLEDANRLVALRLEDQEYQYATTSAYSPTMSEIPAQAQLLEPGAWPSNKATNEGASRSAHSGFEIVYPGVPEPDPPRSLNLPCFLLGTHTGNEDFCGREDILELIAAELLPSTTTVTAVGTTLRQYALCGFGGIGKTEIAREFTRRHKSAFDAVFWVLADETAKLDEHYQQISLALGLEDASECKSQVVSREIVKGWFSCPRKDMSDPDDFVDPRQSSPEASWLLIFDNADDPIILADYWPQGSGSILVTSRDPLAKSMFTRKPSGLDLGPLTTHDSMSLFNHLTSASDESEEETARQISEALGGIPLAISQIAGIIRRQDLTLVEFYELYTNHEEHADLYKTKFDTNLVSYRHSLSTVWAVDKLKPSARRLLELIIFLDPDVVGEDLLMEIAAEHISENAPFRKSSYLEARADLLQSSLVQRNKQKQQISVHRIVQDVVLATMDDSRKKSLFDHILTTIWANWPSAMPKPSREPILPKPKSSGGRLHIGRWPACAALYPHVLRLHQVWSTVSGPSDATSLHFAKLLTEAAWYQKERGQTKGFDGFFDTARSICEPSSHPDRDSLLADIYFCLGAIAMDASDFETSRIYKEQSLDLVSKICAELGTIDERLYLAYAERGISRTQDKRYEEGEADFKEALRMRKALGNYIPRSGEANLSWALLAQGKLDECDTLLTESLAGREKALGKDDRESVKTGLILHVLGNLRAAQGRPDESCEYHQRALVHMRATVGERDPYTAIVYHKMAEHMFRLDQGEDAIVMANRALDIWSVDQNAHKNAIARTTFLKAKLFAATGKTAKASIAFRVACRLRKEITEEDRDLKSLDTEDFDSMVAFWAH